MASPVSWRTAAALPSRPSSADASSTMPGSTTSRASAVTAGPPSSLRRWWTPPRSTAGCAPGAGISGRRSSPPDPPGRPRQAKHLPLPCGSDQGKGGVSARMIFGNPRNGPSKLASHQGHLSRAPLRGQLPPVMIRHNRGQKSNSVGAVASVIGMVAEDGSPAMSCS